MTSHLSVDDMLGLVGWVHLMNARCRAVVVIHRLNHHPVAKQTTNWSMKTRLRIEQVPTNSGKKRIHNLQHLIESRVRDG
jgi:hypothetical protein